MEYEINPNKINCLVGVPIEIKTYFNEINADSLKILFLIFSENCSINKFEIASKLNISLQRVEDSLNFWLSKKIIKTKNSNSPIKIFKKPSAYSISTEELVNAKNNNENVNTLFNEAEKLFARPLKPIERRAVLFAFDYYDLSADVILMIIDFCLRNNQSTKQILSLCENFSDIGIKSHEQAEQQILKLSEQNSIESQIKNCFGIYNRKLSANEKKLIFKWTKTYKFTINLIKMAFNACVDSTGKLSFQYIDKILSNWKQNKVKNLTDISKLNNNKNSIKQNLNKSNKTSYNLDELIAKNNLIKFK